MLFLLIVLIFVRKGESGGEGVELNKCLAPGGGVARPLPPPSACKDKDPVICSAIFSPRVPDIPNNAVALVLFENFFSSTSSIVWIIPRFCFFFQHSIFDLNSICLNNKIYCRTNPFYVNPNCQNVTVMANAEALCPSSCAVCCLTPEFNCRNCMFLFSTSVFTVHIAIYIFNLFIFICILIVLKIFYKWIRLVFQPLLIAMYLWQHKIYAQIQAQHRRH